MVCVTVNLMDMRRLRKEMYTFLVEDSLCRLLLFICYELAQRAAAIFASNIYSYERDKPSWKRAVDKGVES